MFGFLVLFLLVLLLLLLMLLPAVAMMVLSMGGKGGRGRLASYSSRAEQSRCAKHPDDKQDSSCEDDGPDMAARAVVVHAYCHGEGGGDGIMSCHVMSCHIVGGRDKRREDSLQETALVMVKRI